MFCPSAADGRLPISRRALSRNKLGDKLGQRFYVETRRRPAGHTAARTVISSAPDGYTLALLSNGTAGQRLPVQEAAFDSAALISSRSPCLGFFDFGVCDRRRLREFGTLAELSPRKSQPGALNVGTIKYRQHQNLSPNCSRPRPPSISPHPLSGNTEIQVALLQGDMPDDRQLLVV